MFTYYVTLCVTNINCTLHYPSHVFRCVTSHPGQLSLAIPSWVGAVSTSQRAVTPCGWGVEAGMVSVWVAGKTVWTLVTHGPYLSALETGHNKALYRCTFLTLLLLFSLHYYTLCLKRLRRYSLDNKLTRSLRETTPPSIGYNYLHADHAGEAGTVYSCVCQYARVCVDPYEIKNSYWSSFNVTW